MKNYIQPGNVLTLVAPADLDSGDVFAVGQIVGVASGDATTGQNVETAVAGVFRVAKTGGQSVTQGAALYLDTGAGTLTTTASGNVPAGHAVEAATAAAPTVAVRLPG